MVVAGRTDPDIRGLAAAAPRVSSKIQLSELRMDVAHSCIKRHSIRRGAASSPVTPGHFRRWEVPHEAFLPTDLHQAARQGRIAEISPELGAAIVAAIVLQVMLSASEGNVQSLDVPFAVTAILRSLGVQRRDAHAAGSTSCRRNRVRRSSIALNHSFNANC